MRIYLDNCCFNRPFDNQSTIRIKLETDAKLHIQLMILIGQFELAWSYILDFENEANPFPERKNTIENWRQLSIIDIKENNSVLLKANNFTKEGIKPKDALHIASALEADCKYFLTTDDFLLKRGGKIKEIKIVDPIDFIKVMEEL